MSIDLIIVQIINAIFYASILFLISSGLSLIYGIMRILNLSHGALYMLGAYVAYTTVVMWLGISWFSMVIGFIFSCIILAMFGLFMERIFIKPLYDKPEELQLLLTFAFILILDDVVKIIWGAQYRAFPTIPGESIPIGEFRLPIYFIGTILLSLMVGVWLWWFFNKTIIGKQLKASAYNSEIASALGINTDKVYILAFSLGAALSGLAGAVAVPLYTASPGMGGDAIVLSFAVIVIGGMGSISGAFIGSLIVGFSRIFMAILYPVLEIALIYVIMAIVLLIKPTGLFGMREVERK